MGTTRGGKRLMGRCGGLWRRLDTSAPSGRELELMLYPLGSLAPDRNPRLNDETLRVADGVYPSPDGYKPVGQWVQLYTALPASPKGGASFVSGAGTASIVAGTATALYRVFSAGFTAIATGYSIQGDQRWRFAQFGGLAVATNGADPMQKINLTDMTVSPLGGSPPKFEALAVVKGFLVGTVMDGDVLTMAWSGAFNAESWNFGTGQSDYQTMPTGGRINGVFGGEFGIVLQRDRIVRMDYTGGNFVFDFNEVSSNIGCVTVHSVAQWGDLGFFLSDEGFMQWDGAGLVPIGREVIDAEFRTLYGVSNWQNMSTAIDPVRGVVIWSIYDPTTPSNSKMYCYDWTLRKMSTIPYASPIIFSGVTKGVSIDEDEPGVTGDDVIDTGGLVTLDDARFRGGDPRMYVFASDFKLGVLTGTPMAATFTGNDLEMFPGKRADVRMVRPDIDAVSGVTVTLAYKQRLGDSASTVATSTLQASGDMAIRASGRYIRPTIAVAAGTAWTHAKAIELVGRPGAGR